MQQKEVAVLVGGVVLVWWLAGKKDDPVKEPASFGSGSVGGGGGKSLLDLTQEDPGAAPPKPGEGPGDRNDGPANKGPHQGRPSGGAPGSQQTMSMPTWVAPAMNLQDRGRAVTVLETAERELTKHHGWLKKQEQQLSEGKIYLGDSDMETLRNQEISVARMESEARQAASYLGETQTARVGAVLRKASAVRTMLRAMQARKESYHRKFLQQQMRDMEHTMERKTLALQNRMKDGAYEQHIQHKDARITSLQSSLQNAARSHSDNQRHIAHLQSELEKTTHETAGKANRDIEMDGMGDTISFD